MKDVEGRFSNEVYARLPLPFHHSTPVSHRDARRDPHLGGPRDDAPGGQEAAIQAVQNSETLDALDHLGAEIVNTVTEVVHGTTEFIGDVFNAVGDFFGGGYQGDARRRIATVAGLVQPSSRLAAGGLEASGLAPSWARAWTCSSRCFSCSCTVSCSHGGSGTPRPGRFPCRRP
jgi:hypothetical protein